MSSMNELLAEVEAWLGSHDPELLEGLRPGAADDQIDSVQELFPVSLPLDLRCLYRWHDGQTSKGTLPALGEQVSQGALMPLANLRETIERHRLQRQTEGLAADWWGPGFLPFLDAGNGDYLVLDLPTGEIKEFRHETPERPTVHVSLRGWLEKISCNGHEASGIESFLEPAQPAQSWPELRDWILSLQGEGSPLPFVKIALHSMDREPDHPVEVRLLGALRAWLEDPGEGTRRQVSDTLAERSKLFIRAAESSPAVQQAARAATARDLQSAAHCALHAVAGLYPDLVEGRRPEMAVRVQAEIRSALKTRA